MSKQPAQISHRSRAGIALCALVVIAASAACAQDSADEAASGPAAPAPAVSALPSPTATPAFPVTVPHAFGSTTIPAAPQRVVSVGVTEQDTILALGVTPVGVTEWYGEQPFATWPWAQDELGDAEPTVLTTSDGLDFEAIAALKPDLIIGTNAGIEADSYATLSAIAPTIAQAGGGEGYFSPWDEQAMMIGSALGKRGQVEELVAGIKDKFAAAAAANPEFAGKAIVFLQNAISDGSAIAYQDGLSTEFLTDLGFTIPAALDDYVPEGDVSQAYIPLERLAVLDAADVLLWATEAPEDRPKLESEALYRNLEEVRQGRLVFTDEITAGAIYFTSPLSLPYVLDVLVPALKSAVAGTPATTVGTP